MKRDLFSMKLEEKTVAQAFDEFIVSCKAKNLSPETIKSYKQKTRFFVEPMADRPIESIGKEDVLVYITQQQATNVIDTTIQNRVRHLRSFLYYCMENDYLDHFKIELPKAEDKIKETYNEAELTALLKKPNIKKCKFQELEAWALVNYLLATGNRISSAIGLRIGDLDFSNCCIMIKKTKNRHQQILPMSDSLAEVLISYLSYRKGEPEEFVFCNRFGEKLTVSVAEKLVAKFNNERGVKKTSLHLFRHTFAKMYLLNGGDAFRLQKIMGHSTLDTTKRYVNMFTNDLALNFNSLCPLSAFSTNSRKTIQMR